MARKTGRFELADGGTLFLDEIGELTLPTPGQAAAGAAGAGVRAGRRQPSRSAVDVRVIAATNSDLEEAMARGRFREDLYYRLNVFPIFIPSAPGARSPMCRSGRPLPEKYAREHGKPIKRIATSAIDMLAGYHWPGNVRELENTMERAVLMADGEVIHGHHLPPTLQSAEATGTVISASLGGAVGAFERGLIEDALKTAAGNRAKAARLLSTTERVINYKVRKYGIEPRQFRV